MCTGPLSTSAGEIRNPLKLLPYRPRHGPSFSTQSSAGLETSQVGKIGDAPPAGHARQLCSHPGCNASLGAAAGSPGARDLRGGGGEWEEEAALHAWNARVEKFLLSPPPCVRSCALRARLLGSRLQSSPWALLSAAPPALLTAPDTPRRRPRAGCLPPPPSATHAQLRPQGLPQGCSAGFSTFARAAWFPNQSCWPWRTLPPKGKPRVSQGPGSSCSCSYQLMHRLVLSKHL